MIQLNLTGQELFDAIMSVYLASNSPQEGAAEPEEADTAARRKALLDKLHDAFEDVQLEGKRRESVAESFV
jgi:hypothetical protein